MIHEITTNFDPRWGQLVDIDVLGSGEWTGIFRCGEGLVIRTQWHSVPAPDGIRFPLIRGIDSEQCVLVDTRTQAGRANAWVLSLSENEFRPFFAGDGIHDVLANSDAIVVTYFDEGIFSGTKPSQDGVAIFTSSGELRAGYRSWFGAHAVDIADCYAACWENDLRVVFLPYTGFPLVRLDLQALRQSVEPTPRVVHGASAISLFDDVVLFYSPYDERNCILRWTLDGSPSIIGRHPGPLRGLRGGRFLAHGTSGFTVVDAAQHPLAADGGRGHR